MARHSIMSGFSKLTREEKVHWLASQVKDASDLENTLNSHLHPDRILQGMYEEFSENTVSNYFLPYGLAPNFLINDRLFIVPMVTEESSVVAAASHAAKFWAMNGGFHARVIDRVKVGQVHFTWTGNQKKLASFFNKSLEALISSVDSITEKMQKRGGGIKDIKLIPKTDKLDNYYQLFITFCTADAMGANFINSVLEELSRTWYDLVTREGIDGNLPGEISIIMSILSNYTPESLVECYVEAPVRVFERIDNNLDGARFAEKFVMAVDIARKDTYRAATHNKGILNGMDAVVMATGNDFRAVESSAHTYASRDGSYSSLSYAEVKSGIFRFALKVPMAVGTIGGLTQLHPLAKKSLEILGDPDSSVLMEIIASTGLANNFSAIRSLITKGIQHGHMKMHLSNILLQLKASEQEKEEAHDYFGERTVSHAAVETYLNSLRNQKEMT